MSYVKNKRRLYGLGGVENCGNDQVWDPNIVVNAGTAYELRGQCMPRANYSASQLENVNAYPGVVKTAGSSSSSGGGLLSSILGVLTAPAAPAPPVVVAPVDSGMSTATKVALFGGAAIVVIAILKKGR